MKSLLTLKFLLLTSLLLGQIDFEWPRHSDGSKIASEKFEMLEEYFNRQKGNVVVPTSALPDQQLSSRAMGEVQVGVSGFSESELHAAVNPTDPNNIVIGVMRFDALNFLESLTMSIYVTHDLGDTWQISDFKTLHPTRLTAGGGDPMFAFDDSGDLYFSWLRLDVSDQASNLDWGMYAAKSVDGGLTWIELAKPIEYGRTEDLIAFSDLEVAPDKQWMAADISDSSPYKGNVYLAHVNIRLNNENYEITFRRKLAGETEFDSTKIVLANSVQDLSQFANIEVDSDGNIYVSYLQDIDDRLHTYTSYLCVSQDGGESFSDPIEIGEMYFPDFASGWLPIDGLDVNRAYPCPQLGVDRSSGAYNGRLYYTFSAYGVDTLEQPALDIYLTYSDDQGQTWTEPSIVNDDFSGNHQYYSSITVNDKGTLAMAWYDRRGDVANEAQTEYYLAYSEDGGDSFTQFPVTGFPTQFELTQLTNGGFGIGEYNEIVSTGDYLIPFWSDGRTNDGDLAVYAYFYNTEISSVLEKKVLLSDAITLSEPYPVPAKESISFDVTLNKNSDLGVRLVDANGRNVRKLDQRSNVVGKQHFDLNLAGVSSGVYWLEIESRFGVQARNIVIE